MVEQHRGCALPHEGLQAVTTFASPTLTSDYQSLCNAVADVLNRQDLLTAIPNFVALANQRISRDMARINHPGCISRTTLFVVGQTTDLPTDFVSVYQLRESDQQRVLSYISPDQFKEVTAQGWPGGVNPYPIMSPYVATASSAGPDYYTIIGNQIWVMPTYSVNSPLKLDLSYYRTMPPLNTTSTANWALVKYPDLFLYGALVHSAPYLKADERLEVWEGAYQKILTDIEIEASRATRPQTKLNAARKAF